MLRWYNNMTNDYKKYLMDFLTGNFVETPSHDDVKQQGRTVGENILTDYLQDNYTTTNCIVTKTIKSVTDGNMLCLLWDRDNSKSIIVIFDETMHPMALLTGYSSGTQFKRIMGINVGEDGNYFLIENTGSAIRFVMSSNITAGDVNGDFKAVLRKAYNVGGNLTNMVVMYEIVKYPGLSKYLVVGADTDMQPAINIATEIVVQVGMPNEYNDFTFDAIQVEPIYKDIYYTLDDEEIKFMIVGTNSAFYTEMKNTGYSITSTVYTLTDIIGAGLVIDSSVVATGLDESYILTFTLTDKAYRVIRKEGIGFGELIVDPSGYGTIQMSMFKYMTINKINGIKYGCYIIENNGMYQVKTFTIDFYDMIYNTNTVSERYDLSMFTDVNLLTSASNSFDLYNFVYTFGKLTTNTYLVYNKDRYNGDEYVSFSWFEPTYAMMYYRTQYGIVPLFARGLYNYTMLNNTSTAVVNVPNQYLNDIDFETSLYGYTAGELVQKSGLRKNIYENLLINFNNSITITNDGIYMATPSKTLNYSINYDGYQTKRLGYVRINFVGQTTDLPIELTKIVDFKYTIDFNLYAGEDINSIQILSEDKQTIYDSFNIDYEIGKVYSVTRTVQIGG